MSTKQVATFTAEKQDLATFVIAASIFLQHSFSTKVLNTQKQEGFSYILLHFHSSGIKRCVNCKHFICNCQANEHRAAEYFSNWSSN